MCADTYSISDRTPTQTVLNRWIGRRFGRLVVIAFHHRGKDGAAHWECQCDCGEISSSSNSNLLSGRVLSCGCLQREIVASNNTTHGMSKTRAYSIWHSMINRCQNENGIGWAYYVGRGITVCERWQHFENFVVDMGEPPPRRSIDRIDNNRGYEPGNCCWATASEQARNRRTNVIIEYDGRRQIAADWAKEYGMPVGVLFTRLHSLGWDLERALTEPVHIHQRKHPSEMEVL